MTGRIYRPDENHPDPYQQDLGPDAGRGINYGDVGEEVQPDSTRTAKDVAELHSLLDLNDDELDRIPLLAPGTRLETGATYVNLAEQELHEFTALGDEEVSAAEWVVPKKEVDYELWNRILGIRRTPK